MAKNDNDFSVTLNDEGTIHADPVMRAVESPLATLAQNVSSMEILLKGLWMNVT